MSCGLFWALFWNCHFSSTTILCNFMVFGKTFVVVSDCREILALVSCSWCPICFNPVWTRNQQCGRCIYTSLCWHSVLFTIIIQGGWVGAVEGVREGNKEVWSTIITTGVLTASLTKSLRSLHSISLSYFHMNTFEASPQIIWSDIKEKQKKSL